MQQDAINVILPSAAWHSQQQPCPATVHATEHAEGTASWREVVLGQGT